MPVLRIALALPTSKITNVPKRPIPGVAQTGISEVISLGKCQIISRTYSSCNSLVWPVWKPDERWHLTIDDYWHLNANTVLLTAAAPSMTTSTATLQAAAHLCTAALKGKDMSFMVPCRRRVKKNSY